jgi:hypothetical protein
MKETWYFSVKINGKKMTVKTECAVEELETEFRRLRQSLEQSGYVVTGGTASNRRGGKRQ